MTNEDYIYALHEDVGKSEQDNSSTTELLQQAMIVNNINPDDFIKEGRKSNIYFYMIVLIILTIGTFYVVKNEKIYKTLTNEIERTGVISENALNINPIIEAQDKNKPIPRRSFKKSSTRKRNKIIIRNNNNKKIKRDTRKGTTPKRKATIAKIPSGN